MFSAAKTSGPSGYNINNSLRFRGSATAYLSRTPASAGNRKTWTWSAWIKLGTISVNMGTLFIAQGQTAIYLNDGTNSSFRVNGAAGSDLITSLMPRDPSAWYHLVVACDTTQATDTNRLKIYVNGVQQTAFQAGSAYPTLNGDTFVNSTAAHYIGRRVWNSDQQYDGYMAEVNLIDGQALTPSSFGSTNATTGVWQPKKYTGSYGTNGFYLPFSDIATTSGSNAGLGKDFSGNGNYWTTNNISVTSGTTYDAMTDSPTNTSATVANYAVLNPVIYSPSTTYSRANLSFTASVANWTQAVGTIVIPSTGKWYWEVVVGSSIGAGQMHGITATSSTLYSAGSTNWVGWNPLGYAYFNDGTKYNNNAGVAYGNSYTANDIIGIAFDADNGKLFFSKNGTWQASGDPVAGTNAAFTGLTNTYYPAFSLSTNTGATTADVNFGQRPFSYTPPTGFNRLNTFNLPNSTVVKGNTVMDATLYTGTATGAGANTITITNQAGFKPDFVWAKGRSIAYVHGLFNSVCGVNRFLTSNGTQAEAVNEVDGYLTSFNSNGFTLSNGSNSNLTFNSSPSTYVAWQWQAGQGTNTTNTAGSITSTVSVNATAGFSIVTYTGTGSAASIGHGLGITPEFIIVKRRDTTANWMVVSRYLTNYNWYLKLNSTDAQVGDATIGNIDPTSTIFNVGTNAIDNASGGTYVAYVWAPISGFSKFGSYTGNGSADGPFVYLGFRPKFVMIKSTTQPENWFIMDSSRNTYNVTNLELFPNATNAEVDGSTRGPPVIQDFLSNGFKIRGTNPEMNQNGDSYIYMAFAENPFKNALAR